MERVYNAVGNRKILKAELTTGSITIKDYRNDYSFDSLNRLTRIEQTTQGNSVIYFLIRGA